MDKRTTAVLASLNLTGNPFEDFELFEETLDEETIETHKTWFKDRAEIAQKLFLGIASSSSYKVVLHGDLGAGKSSLLNRILYDARKGGYFATKYRMSSSSAENMEIFEKELLKAFGEEITREALRNKSFRDVLKSIVKSDTKRDLKQLSLIAMLYSSGQVTIKEGKVETTGLSATIGIPILKADVSGEEQEYIEISRVETLSHMVFARLLRDGIGLLKELGYKGVVIAIDEIDKLEEKFETRILTIVKDTFYPSALCHLLLVMRTRDGRKMIHPDIFFYEPVHPLAKRYIYEFLEELYSSKAIDKKKSLQSLMHRTILDKIYENSDGRIRPILKDLSSCIITAAMLGKTHIDDAIYKRTKVTDPLYAYVSALRPTDHEYRILSYLLQNESTYVRDPKLSRYCGLAKSALGSKLGDLSNRHLVISQKEGRKLVFSIDPAIKSIVKSIVT